MFVWDFTNFAIFNQNTKVKAAQVIDDVFMINARLKTPQVLLGGEYADLIYGGIGNDYLYGQAGTNMFVFGEGDGQDYVFSGKGTDTIKFDESVWGNLKFEQGVGKNKRDLIIKYNEGRDSVTVKKYFVVNKKGVIITNEQFDKFDNLKHLTIQTNIEYYNLSDILYRINTLEFYD